MKEFLSWLCLFGGTVIFGSAVALIIAYIERKRKCSRDIYYLYAEHMEKSSDRRRNHENVNRCVCCGEIIPEGRQVCPICESKKSLNDEFGFKKYGIHHAYPTNIIKSNNYTDTDIIYRRNK